MRGPARPQQSTVTTQVEIKLGWMGDVGIDDCSSRTISTAVGIPLVVREHSINHPIQYMYVVALSKKWTSYRMW